MNVQTVLVVLCVLAALGYLLRPWLRRWLGTGTRGRDDEAPVASACGACKGCSRHSGGCH